MSYGTEEAVKATDTIHHRYLYGSAPSGSACEGEDEGEGEIGRGRDGPPTAHLGDATPPSELQQQADLGYRRARGGDPEAIDLERRCGRGGAVGAVVVTHG